MRKSRDLPDDLVVQLRRVYALEKAEDSSPRVGGARAATGTLMLAAVEAGWKTTDIAKVLGMKIGTASKRVRDARTRRGDAPVGLVVDEPAEVHGPLAELDTPVEDRQWLSRGEAADYLAVSARTVHNYWELGLLPNTRDLTRSRRAYLRADLDRIRHGPRRGVFLDRAALRTTLEPSAGGS